MMHHNWFQTASLFIATAAAGLLAGCDAQDDLGFSVRTLPASSDEQVIAAAQDAFREHFRIDRSTRGSAILIELRGEPAESIQKGGTGRLGDEVRATPTQVRQTAVLRVARQGQQLRGSCQVRQQRLDTAQMEMFRREQMREDLPTDTPIDREATTAEQDAVWTDTGRDTALEREILSSLIERLTPATPAGAPPG